MSKSISSIASTVEETCEAMRNIIQQIRNNPTPANANMLCAVSDSCGKALDRLVKYEKELGTMVDQSAVGQIVRAHGDAVQASLAEHIGLVPEDVRDTFRERFIETWLARFDSLLSEQNLVTDNEAA